MEIIEIPSTSQSPGTETTHWLYKGLPTVIASPAAAVQPAYERNDVANSCFLNLCKTFVAIERLALSADA